MADPDDQQQEWKPRPDPTALTTEALIREIGHLREHLEGLIEANGRVDKERFDNIDQRFHDRDLLVQQAFENVSEATASALAASKEAVTKSETAVEKELDSLRVLHESRSKHVDGQINDVKARLDKSEGRGSGTQAMLGVGLALVAIGVAVMSIVVSVVIQ